MARMCEEAGIAEEPRIVHKNQARGAGDSVRFSPNALENLLRFKPSVNGEKVRALFLDCSFIRGFRAVLKDGPERLPCRAFKSDRIYPDIRLLLRKLPLSRGRGGTIVPAPDAVTGYARIPEDKME